jgi:pyruvate dehydrogenase (quinone)
VSPIEGIGQVRGAGYVAAMANTSVLTSTSSVTAEMAKGFSLYMVKAVMNGRTDEIADFAKTNLWR